MHLLWIQAGACGGDSLSLLCADNPSLEQLVDEGLELLWHPSLSTGSTGRLRQIIADILAGRTVLEILCIEGSLITAPRNTGLWDRWGERGKKDMIAELAEAAAYVLAVETCAAYGGIHAAPPNPSNCTGLQFDKTTTGGLLPAHWRSRSGLPVINQELWNSRSSKTRTGVPCFGCTSPGFPRDGDLFRTDKIGHIPLRLPLGVQRAHYMAYKDPAQEAAPERLVLREMEP